MVGEIVEPPRHQLTLLLHEHADALAYVVLAEVLDRKARRAAGRLDLSALDLGSPEGRADRLAHQVLAWVQARLAEEQPQGSGITYMLKLYGSGGRYLRSLSFPVRWSDPRPQRPPRRRSTNLPAPPTAPAVTVLTVPLDPQSLPEARVWRALGAAIEHLLDTMTRSTGEIVDTQSRLIARQSGQLEAAWALIGALAERLAAERLERATEQRAARWEDRRARARAELVAAFLGELARVVEAMPGAATISPARADLLALLEATPELEAALRDPTVRARLQDPMTRAAVVRALQAESEGTNPS